MAAPLVIVGAGVAGLTLGLALKRRGVEALIVERREALPLAGAGIQIGPNGTHCLRALGVFDAVQVQASAPDAIAVHDGGSGRVLTRLPLGAWIAQRHGAPYWVTRRSDLTQALFDAARSAGVEVRFGVEVESLRDNGGDVVMACADGTFISAPGVIGADGLWSRVRGALFGNDDVVPSGRVAARAIVDSADVPLIRRDVVSVWLAPETHLVCYPVQRGAALNIVLISNGETAPRWSQPIDVRDVRRRLAAFAEPLHVLGDAARDWRQWPLVTRTPLKHYAVGRVGLVGDAAHPMLPFLAQGAVMALEDALVLSELVSKGDVVRALADYSADRVARTQRVVRTATQQGQTFHLGGSMRLARDGVLAIAPPALMMRRYDWLYGWRR